MKDDLRELRQELRDLYSSDYEVKNFDSLTDLNQIQRLIRKRSGENLVKRLESCKPGSEEWKKFQDICLELVKLTLEKNEFEECTTSSELPATFVPLDSKGVRKDIVIPLNPKKVESDDDVKTIWDTFKYKPWYCRYLVFDAKNYNGKITDKEVYQMFHYLNGRNGRIGIIFSRKYTIDESGKAVLRRIREENYMVFVLNDSDIKTWIDYYISEGHVRTFFRDLLTKYDHSFG